MKKQKSHKFVLEVTLGLVVVIAATFVTFVPIEVEATIGPSTVGGLRGR